MRIPITVLYLMCSVAARSVLAGPLEQGQKCDDNQLTLNRCASFEFGQADEELNALYKEQVERLSPKTQKRLRLAQRSWIAFRDADCRYRAGPREESGSIWELQYLSCMTKHTTRRIEDIKGYLACTENGCPE